MVYIILLNYNGWSDTIECLNSIHKIDYKNYQTILVDNASLSRPPELIKIAQEKCDIFIQSPSNQGFAFGNNLGIKYALEHNTDFILLLNNDTIVEPDFLKLMIEKAQDNDFPGIIGCKILFYNDRNKVWFNGGKVNWWKGIGLHFDINKNLEETTKRSDIEYITGCVMLIRRNVINKIGFLDENYFMYYEDVEYSQRAIQNGYSIDYHPEAIVYHKIGASGGSSLGENTTTVFYGNKSRRKFISSKVYKERLLPRLTAILYYSLSRLLKSFMYLLFGRYTLFKALIYSFIRKKI